MALTFKLNGEDYKIKVGDRVFMMYHPNDEDGGSYIITFRTDQFDDLTVSDNGASSYGRCVGFEVYDFFDFRGPFETRLKLLLDGIILDRYGDPGYTGALYRIVKTP